MMNTIQNAYQKWTQLLLDVKEIKQVGWYINKIPINIVKLINE